MTKLLLIEDEHALRSQVTEYLGFEGFDVLAAADGLEGLQLARAHHPDLIISDIAMPKMDGFAVLSELQKQPDTAAIPFIFLTARAERNSVRQGMEMGADDYVTKPFTAEELVSAINARLRKQEVVTLATTTELERIKFQLASTVSTELSSPIAEIMSVQRTLSDQWTQLSFDELSSLFNRLQDGTHQLHHMVEQMVLLAQVEGGTLDASVLRTFAVNTRVMALLAAAINLAHQFTRRGTDRSIRLSAFDQEAMIRCHPQSLVFALAEAILNVTRFTPAGSEVVVSLWNRNSVTGIRILAEKSDIIHVDENTPGSFEDAHGSGLGVGLPLAKRIIEAHGGTLGVRANVGQPAGIVIQLPTGDE